jgi:hypothetical protein
LRLPLAFAHVNHNPTSPSMYSPRSIHLPIQLTELGSISSLSSFESLAYARSSKAPESPLSRGSHCLYACGFRIYFTPLPGFFSPFPHGTGSLSVGNEYLALEDGPPIFRQDFTCPALLLSRLVPRSFFRLRGYHPLWPDFPDCSTRRIAKT